MVLLSKIALNSAFVSLVSFIKVNSLVLMSYEYKDMIEVTTYLNVILKLKLPTIVFDVVSKVEFT